MATTDSTVAEWIMIHDQMESGAGPGPGDPGHVPGLTFASASGAAVLHSQRKTYYSSGERSLDG